jgi:hypothetical protein
VWQPPASDLRLGRSTLCKDLLGVGTTAKGLCHQMPCRQSHTQMRRQTWCRLWQPCFCLLALSYCDRLGYPADAWMTQLLQVWGLNVRPHVACAAGADAAHLLWWCNAARNLNLLVPAHVQSVLSQRPFWQDVWLCRIVEREVLAWPVVETVAVPAGLEVLEVRVSGLDV